MMELVKAEYQNSDVLICGRELPGASVETS